MAFKTLHKVYLPLLLIFCGLAHTSYVLKTQSPQTLSSDPHYRLDADSYLEGAKWMLSKDNFLYTQDIYHSPGAQVITSWIMRLTGRHDPLSFRYVNFFGFCLLTLIIFLILKKYISQTHSLWTIAFICASPFWKLYLGTIQYEIWLCLFFSLSFYLLINEFKKPWMKVLGLSVFVLLAFLIRYHFIILVPLIIYLLGDRRERLVFFSLTIIGIAGVCFVYVNEGVDWIQLASNSAKQLRWLSPTSQGYNYPYPEPTAEEAGWMYIIKHPFHYSYQLVRRFFYLFGIFSDGYPNPTLVSLVGFSLLKIDLRALSNLVATITMIAGMRYAYIHQRKMLKTYLALSLVIYLPFLIVGTTQRFLLPLYGIHYLFLCFGLLHIKARCQKFRHSLGESD